MAFVIRGDYRCKTPLRCKIRNPHRILFTWRAHQQKKPCLFYSQVFFGTVAFTSYCWWTLPDYSTKEYALRPPWCAQLSLYLSLQIRNPHRTPGRRTQCPFKNNIPSAGLQLLPSVMNAVENTNQLFFLLFVFLSNSDAFVFTGPHLMLCPPPLCLFYLLSQMVRLTDFHFRCHIFKATHGAIFLTNTWPRSLWRHYLYHSHSHVSALRKHL